MLAAGGIFLTGQWVGTEKAAAESWRGKFTLVEIFGVWSESHCSMSQREEKVFNLFVASISNKRDNVVYWVRARET